MPRHPDALQESLWETLDILATPGALEEIQEAEADIAAGRTFTMEELRAEFGSIARLPRGAWLAEYSPATARAYLCHLEQFTTWLGRTGRTLDDATAGLLSGWVADLSAGRGWGTEAQFREWKAAMGVDPADRSPEIRARWLAAIAAGTAPGTPLTKASQAHKSSAVVSFYKFARFCGATTIDPAPFRAPKPKRDDTSGSVDVDAAERLWHATRRKPRLRALVAVMLFCGLRVAEAVGLQVSDMQEQQGFQVLRVMGKGSKPRTAVLPAAAVDAIQQWLQVRGDQDGPLFSTRTGRALSARGAHREVRALGAKVGIAGLHPTTLRHTFATTWVDGGGDILSLTTALGHASSSATMRYIRGRDVITNSPVHKVAAHILRS